MRRSIKVSGQSLCRRINANFAHGHHLPGGSLGVGIPPVGQHHDMAASLGQRLCPSRVLTASRGDPVTKIPFQDPFPGFPCVRSLQMALARCLVRCIIHKSQLPWYYVIDSCAEDSNMAVVFCPLWFRMRFFLLLSTCMRSMHSGACQMASKSGAHSMRACLIAIIYFRQSQ